MCNSLRHVVVRPLSVILSCNTVSSTMQQVPAASENSQILTCCFKSWWVRTTPETTVTGVQSQSYLGQLCKVTVFSNTPKTIFSYGYAGRTYNCILGSVKICLTAWCRLFLKRLIVAQLGRIFPASMKAEGSLPSSQKPFTRP
jgi:hypothetical protein